jgi:hypothetical protein
VHLSLPPSCSFSAEVLPLFWIVLHSYHHHYYNVQKNVMGHEPFWVYVCQVIQSLYQSCFLWVRHYLIPILKMRKWSDQIICSPITWSVNAGTRIWIQEASFQSVLLTAALQMPTFASASMTGQPYILTISTCTFAIEGGFLRAEFWSYWIFHPLNVCCTEVNFSEHPRLQNSLLTLRVISSSLFVHVFRS